ncbi:MAG TPA: hypothetical protein P5313_12380 [Spirochaetia bacterium]|nr:hypothetical protein [Spirochaetales bacterium]HRY81208.1 hypothetical protein [Spirochaetia bacterium]
MWSTFALSPGTTYAIRFPGVNLYFRAEGVLWGVASEFVAKPQRPAPAAVVRNPPKTLEWKYSALLGAAELTLRPTLSPRAYEVQLTQAVSILPGVELDGYVFLPLRAEVLAAEGTILASLPLQRRKNSWFGSPQEGVLCEAVVSAFSAAEELGRFLADPSPALAVCPISVRNDMAEGMDLVRLCIPTDILSVYGGEGIYATDRVLCSFTSDGLQVRPKRGMDPLLGRMEVRHAARKGPEERFFSRGMDILRYITGI